MAQSGSRKEALTLESRLFTDALLSKEVSPLLSRRLPPEGVMAKSMSWVSWVYMLWGSEHSGSLWERQFTFKMGYNLH